MPVHNEASRLERKIENTDRARLPAGPAGGDVRLRRLDRRHGRHLRGRSCGPAMRLDRAADARRQGAGAQRRAARAAATRSSCSPTRRSSSSPTPLRSSSRPFADPDIGCVSGEDRIADAGGEGLYGRYELLLRRLESRVHSIVGASGSFYAQRRSLCQPFTEGMAPDFLSVLRTVEQGYRAVSEDCRRLDDQPRRIPRQEFERKVRTLIRGMTTLFAHVVAAESVPLRAVRVRAAGRTRSCGGSRRSSS